MKEIVKMSIDLELELDCGEMSSTDFDEINEKLGCTAFNEQGVPTKELIEKEKFACSDGVRNDLESLDYKVSKIYNVEVSFI